MRHDWVRDIADFAKYGLLKRLAADDLRIGVFWYVTTYAGCQPSDGQLSVPVFYSRPLSTTVIERRLRRADRDRWFQAGRELTRDCDLIFLDPDTGVLPDGRKAENAGGEEYAAIEEILSLCQRGQSVVCVQFGAPGNFEREPEIARRRLAALSAALKAESFSEPWGLWWRDRHKVGLLVAPSKAHSDRLRCRRDEVLVDPAWNGRVAYFVPANRLDYHDCLGGHAMSPTTAVHSFYLSSHDFPDHGPQEPTRARLTNLSLELHSTYRLIFSDELASRANLSLIRSEFPIPASRSSVSRSNSSGRNICETHVFQPHTKTSTISDRSYCLVYPLPAD